MELTGYIEGFYGKIFSWETREAIAKKVFSKGMNTYLYAPKEDKYHRICWEEDYPAPLRDKFAQIIEFAYSCGSTFIPALAPGLSFFYDEADYVFLKKKIKFFVNLGANTFALTMDDIPAISPVEGKKLGVQHGELLCRIKQDFPNLRLLFCPTIYAADLIDETSLYYLDDLKRSAPDDILYLWTGDSTISKKINAQTMEHAIKLFGKKIVIWDNFYCIDYCPNRIFAGEYAARDREFIKNQCAGVLLNGTGLPITDEIILENFDLWLKDKNPSECDIKTVLTNFGVPQNLLEYLPLISSPYRQDYTLPQTLSPDNFFTEIIAKWQSPLKLEWYNALHAIFTQLRISSAKKPFGEEWYGMRWVR
ncbi:MAG: protein O-GlcNAcase [Chitinivibrionia bacterium]|nr:protein O-GlcNAcase [Chitinivibrionia bacterium]